jgi:hypothetical protein
MGITWRNIVVNGMKFPVAFKRHRRQQAMCSRRVVVVWLTDWSAFRLTRALNIANMQPKCKPGKEGGRQKSMSPAAALPLPPGVQPA